MAQGYVGLGLPPGALPSKGLRMRKPRCHSLHPPSHLCCKASRTFVQLGRLTWSAGPLRVEPCFASVLFQIPRVPQAPLFTYGGVARRSYGQLLSAVPFMPETVFYAATHIRQRKFANESSRKLLAAADACRSEPLKPNPPCKGATIKSDLIGTLLCGENGPGREGTQQHQQQFAQTEPRHTPK